MAGELTGLSIASAAALIEKRELSPVELTRACLARIEAVDGALNAFITVTADEALQAAAEAERAIAAGAYRGPLHGMPIALKDLFALQGVRMTGGSRILAEHVPQQDDEVTARLKAAGAVVVGKLNMQEFAFGATGANPHYGATQNPWHTGRITGGSSSGSGAAVAAGQCLAALGTDTGGSIRIPASLCGVTGLKPTYGRVSRRGILPLSWSLDHAGPLARTVEDAAVVLQAIAGHDPGDPSSSREPVPDYRAGLAVGVRGLRLGLPAELFFEGVQPDVEAAVRRAVDTLAGLGAEVREVSLPFAREIPAAVNAIMLPEALAYHQKWMAERPQDYGDEVRHRLEIGSHFLAVHYVQAQRLREMAVHAWRREVFSRVDVLAMPATAVTALPMADADLTATLTLIRLTNPLNLLGVPAVSVPCGFSEEGLPIGLQLAAGWFEEPALLRAAHVYQQATGWHTRRPPL